MTTRLDIASTLLTTLVDADTREDLANKRPARVLTDPERFEALAERAVLGADYLLLAADPPDAVDVDGTPS